MRIHEKVVLITGASEGIVAACGDLYYAGDITLEETRRALVDRTLERFGTIDILINSAGVGLYAPAWCAPIGEVRRMFELNLFALLEMVQLVAPIMQRQRRGTIVNIGSIAGKVTLPW